PRPPPAPPGGGGGGPGRPAGGPRSGACNACFAPPKSLTVCVCVLCLCASLGVYVCVCAPLFTCVCACCATGEVGDVTWPDDWTSVTRDGRRSAQFEHTMMVTEEGCEIFTARVGASRSAIVWDEAAAQRGLA
ncbi:MAG: hypothetical protein P4L40_19150, partial [Terracidiphilus sp.]|nr:hypothetical protein [Terracidiphilus sp.]